MQIIKPSFYDSFQCTADKCPNTCCKNWKIEINQITYNKYQVLRHPLGNELRKNTIRYQNTSDPTYFAYYKLKDKYCPFLSPNKLCNIYTELGEGYMCTVCTLFPRILTYYGDLCEKTLDPACPEVIRFLISSQDAYSFDITEEELTDQEKSYMNKITYNDNHLFGILFNIRSQFIELIQQRTLPFWKRMILLKMAEDQIQHYAQSNDLSLLQNTINNLNLLYNDEAVISQLDAIQVNYHSRINTLTHIFQAKCNNGIIDRDLISLLNDLNTFYSVSSNEKMSEIVQCFDSAFRSKEYVFENLIVHEFCLLFQYVTTIESIRLKVSTIMIHYSLLKQLLLSQWYLNEHSLSDDQLIHIIHIFYREFVHDTSFTQKFNSYLQEQGYTQLNKLFNLIK